jgi:hypothetical protein
VRSVMLPVSRTSSTIWTRRGGVSKKLDRLSLPEDANGSVKDFLIDVSSSWDDFQPPAEACAQPVGDLLAVLEVP